MKMWEYQYKIAEQANRLSVMIESRKAWVEAQADEGMLEEHIVAEFDILAKLTRDWQDCYLLSRSPISEVPE